MLNIIKITCKNRLSVEFFYTFAPQKPRYSAVGSAPRSGRGGRAFESPYLDKIPSKQLKINNISLKAGRQSDFRFQE